jgi:hypothetical protein
MVDGMKVGEAYVQSIRENKNRLKTFLDAADINISKKSKRETK